MKTTEIRNNKKLMELLKTVAKTEGCRSIKTHKHEGAYKAPTAEDSKWIKKSLYDVYAKPCRTKVEIDQGIRSAVADVFDLHTGWNYSGNCFSFSMSIVIKHEGRLYGLTFTRDNLHVVGYDD